MAGFRKSSTPHHLVRAHSTECSSISHQISTFLWRSGDSYSAVGYSPAMHPPPTEDNPLGVQFPGMTWAEDGEPNWVGHLVTNYPPAPLLEYNFARGGDTVIGVRGQMERGFMLHLAGKPDWCAWNASYTLFGENPPTQMRAS